MLIAMIDVHTASTDRALVVAQFVSERNEILSMPGNLNFRVYASPDDDEAVAIIHEWVDEPSFTAYLGSEAFARSGAVVRPLMTSSPVSRRFHAELVQTV